jgi:hypothetical protein
MYGFLTKLKNSVNVVQGNKFEIGLNITQGSPLNSMNSSFVNFKLPVILLDRSSDIELLVEGIQLFSKTAAVVRNYEMLPFMIRTPWCGPRNLLYPILANGLGQLVQSGIYFKWEQLEQVKLQLFEAKRLKNGTLSSSEYKMIYAKSMSRLKKEIIFSEATSVSFQAMKYAFAYCAIMLSFGFVAFLIEIQTLTKVKKFKHVEHVNPYDGIKFPHYMP